MTLLSLSFYNHPDNNTSLLLLRALPLSSSSADSLLSLFLLSQLDGTSCLSSYCSSSPPSSPRLCCGSVLVVRNIDAERASLLPVLVCRYHATPKLSLLVLLLRHFHPVPSYFPFCGAASSEAARKPTEKLDEVLRYVDGGKHRLVIIARRPHNADVPGDGQAASTSWHTQVQSVYWLLISHTLSPFLFLPLSLSFSLSPSVSSFHCLFSSPTPFRFLPMLPPKVRCDAQHTICMAARALAGDELRFLVADRRSA